VTSAGLLRTAEDTMKYVLHQLSTIIDSRLLSTSTRQSILKLLQVKFPQFMVTWLLNMAQQHRHITSPADANYRRHFTGHSTRHRKQQRFRGSTQHRKQQ
jgi:hypothetical protein